MTRKETISYVFSLFSWALLTLGVSELMLVLTLPLYSLVVTMVCACLFSVYIIYVSPGKNSTRKISQSLLACSVFLILLKFLHTGLVLLEVYDQTIVMNFVSLIAFLIGGFVSSAILLKISNGTH